MKYLKFLFLLLSLQVFSLLSYAQTPEFYFNGAADVIFRFPARGTGGRALVHDASNVFSLNYGGDFTGGTRIGNGFNIANDGSFRAFDKLFFSSEGNLGIGTLNPEVPLTVYGKSHFYPSRIGTGDARAFCIDKEFNPMSFMNNDYPIILKTGGGNQPLILNAARVGIGTANPQETLSVNGNIRAKEIKVEATNWPDYVFEAGYNVGTLKGLESYIKTNKHLPEIPGAAEVEKEGIQLGEMNKLLLKKIEELTMHLIEKENQLDIQGKLILKIEERLRKLETSPKRK
ncbi:hypothetical protein QF042_001911 [Pedobacter sp. W3I1]|uniref:hypothetical protein n=1 Tax=Pedobacter sp. W3I1 TaxID=3042291 RepID=UPI0027850C37|nr:hypothetical protein [Pedobacter sp. W3I1]MDQ0638346.1 hypothetical protein [Pedobacter sp. W3I1]